MNSRARVLTSFRHQTPDRVPLDFCAVPEMDEKLIQHLQLNNREELLQRLHVDFRHIDKWGMMLPEYIGPELVTNSDGTTEDMWGCRLKMTEYSPGCFYNEWGDPPLADAKTIQDVEKHRWPKPDWFDFSKVTTYCSEENEYCLVGGRGATLDMLGFFRGNEQAMYDIHDYPVVVEAIMAKIFEFQYEYNIRLLEAAGGRLDILFFSEDMGGQNGLILSKDTLEKYVFQKLEKYSELARKHNALAMLHSDGDIHEIIPDLIELGIEIINPVQECGEMDLGNLKTEFGEKLCFHGLLDSQETLPNFSKQEVLDEVQRLTELMGEKGGMAFSPSCGFQIDVPIENIIAIYDSVGGTK